jgi:quercetin dioxygenase-like cupin family protein
MTKNEEILVLTDVIKVMIDSRITNGKYAMFEEYVPPLGGPPPHQHPDEEIFYILKGEFEFILNDIQNPFKAKAGSVIHIPSNAIHTFKNVGGTVGEMIVLLSPGNLIDYFREIGTPIKEDMKWPDLTKIPDFSKLDIGRALACASQHNIQFHLPELVKD